MQNLSKILILWIISLNLIVANSKSTIAIVNISSDDFSAKELSVIRNRIETELINLNLFRVVDRANMELILDEQGFQLSGCTSAECAVEVGQLLGVQNILTGSISKIENLIIFQIKIINIESGQIVKSISYDFQGNIVELLTNGIQKSLLDLFDLKHAPDKQLNDKGFLQLIVHPSDALITINDNIYSHEQASSMELSPGLYGIDISSKYYYPYSKEVQISQNSLLPLKVNLFSAEKKYKLIRSQSIISTSVSFISIVSTLGFAVTANSHYKNYQNANSEEDAIKYRDSFQKLDKLTMGASAVATLSLTYTIFTLRKFKKLKNEIGL